MQVSESLGSILLITVLSIPPEWRVVKRIAKKMIVGRHQRIEGFPAQRADVARSIVLFPQK
jgi:hypothetical protein